MLNCSAAAFCSFSTRHHSEWAKVLEGAVSKPRNWRRDLIPELISRKVVQSSPIFHVKQRLASSRFFSLNWSISIYIDLAYRRLQFDPPTNRRTRTWHQHYTGYATCDWVNCHSHTGLASHLPITDPELTHALKNTSNKNAIKTVVFKISSSRWYHSNTSFNSICYQ